MQFYVISPINHLNLMDLGDRIFVLAHLWVKYERYREFILAKKEQGCFITLDNSAAERSLVTEDVLIDICKELMPNEVIAPDVLFDHQQTLMNLESFIQRIKQENLLGKIEIFACPQGLTQDLWLYCYREMLANEYVDVIGLSKIAVPKAFLGIDDDQGIMEARHMAYNYLKMNGLLRKPIHCLGQGDPEEFKYYDHPMMRSTDSVYPVLAADLGIDYARKFKRIPTPHDYLESGSLGEANLILALSNIDFLKECCVG